MPRVSKFTLPKLVIALPLVSALLVMSIAAVTRDRLEKGISATGCCNAGRLHLPDIAATKTPAQQRTLTPEMYASRLNFIAAVQIHIVAIIAAAVVGLVLMYKKLNLGTQSWPVRIAFIIGIASLFALLLLDEQPSPALEMLEARTVATEFPRVHLLRFAMEQSTVVAATMLVAAASLLLLPPKGDPLAKLKATSDGYHRLSYLLNAGTLLLGADVLTKAVLMQWTESYFSGADQKSIHTLTERIVAGWGVYDSLLLAATYIPTALILKGRLKAWTAEGQLTEPPTWFNPKWLAEGPLAELGRIAAILAPFVIGQAASALRLT